MNMKIDGYFFSGSNTAGDISGLEAIGCNPGVAVSEVSEAGLVGLEALKGTGLKVFVDSGAFAEVAFEGGQCVVKKAITHEEWERRLAVYGRLAKVLGSQLYCVAPDRVGSQPLTLKRLKRYRWSLLRLRRAGARIIVPIQRGRLTMAKFAERVDAVLGFTDWVKGVPLKKAATTHDELAKFAAGLRRGTRVHLLGKGPYSRDYETCMDMVAHCEVTCDSVRLRSLVGRKPKPRPMTLAQDEVRAELTARGMEPTAFAVRREAIIRVFGAEVGPATTRRAA